MNAMDWIKELQSNPDWTTTEIDWEAVDEIEEELRVLEILHKHKGWVGSLRYLLFRRDYWDRYEAKITDGLLEVSDIPLTVDEFKTVTGWLRRKKQGRKANSTCSDCVHFNAVENVCARTFFGYARPEDGDPCEHFYSIEKYEKEERK